jgi:hypothetical protein
VAHKETPEALAAGRKYLVYTLTSSTLILFSAAAIFVQTGTLDFTPGGFLAGRAAEGMLPLFFALLLFGFGVKAAIMPIHEWLPSAMIAPTPVSALLHAVAVVKAGVFGCLRVILYVFGPALLIQKGLWFPFPSGVFHHPGRGDDRPGTGQSERRLAFHHQQPVDHHPVALRCRAASPAESAPGQYGYLKSPFFCAGAIYVKTHKEW